MLPIDKCTLEYRSFDRLDLDDLEALLHACTALALRSFATLILPMARANLRFTCFCFFFHLALLALIFLSLFIKARVFFARRFLSLPNLRIFLFHIFRYFFELRDLYFFLNIAIFFLIQFVFLRALLILLASL